MKEFFKSQVTMTMAWQHGYQLVNFFSEHLDELSFEERYNFFLTIPKSMLIAHVEELSVYWASCEKSEIFSFMIMNPHILQSSSMMTWVPVILGRKDNLSIYHWLTQFNKDPKPTELHINLQQPADLTTALRLFEKNKLPLQHWESVLSGVMHSTIRISTPEHYQWMNSIDVTSSMPRTIIRKFLQHANIIHIVDPSRWFDASMPVTEKFDWLCSNFFQSNIKEKLRILSPEFMVWFDSQLLINEQLKEPYLSTHDWLQLFQKSDLSNKIYEIIL